MIGDRTEAAVGFLRHALARGALDTSELEAEARAAGLLGERQKIQYAKAFRCVIDCTCVCDYTVGDGTIMRVELPGKMPKKVRRMSHNSDQAAVCRKICA